LLTELTTDSGSNFSQFAYACVRLLSAHLQCLWASDGIIRECHVTSHVVRGIIPLASAKPDFPCTVRCTPYCKRILDACSGRIQQAPSMQYLVLISIHNCKPHWCRSTHPRESESVANPSCSPDFAVDLSCLTNFSQPLTHCIAESKASVVPNSRSTVFRRMRTCTSRPLNLQLPPK